MKAFAIAPLAAPAIYFCGAIAFNINGGLKMHDLISLTIAVLLIALPISYMATAILGVPYYFLLRKYQQLSRRNLVLGGAVLGIMAFLLFWASPFGLSILASLGRSELLVVIGIGAVLGSGVAWLFYTLAGITRPSIGHSR